MISNESFKKLFCDLPDLRTKLLGSAEGPYRKRKRPDLAVRKNAPRPVRGEATRHWLNELLGVDPDEKQLDSDFEY